MEMTMCPKLDQLPTAKVRMMASSSPMNAAENRQTPARLLAA
jgi:hypothetical protein